MPKFSEITVYPKYPAVPDEPDITFTDIDAISLVNDDTFGPAPVFHQNAEFTGTVLYVNPQNITAMEVTA